MPDFRDPSASEGSSAESRPQLSYVLAATTEAEVHNACRWLWQATISPAVEIVLAAPAKVLCWVPARVIPPRVKIVSAIRPVDRNDVRVAGSAATTGLIVIVIDCDEELTSKFPDPFNAASEQPGQDPLHGAPIAALPPGEFRIEADVRR